MLHPLHVVDELAQLGDRHVDGRRLGHRVLHRQVPHHHHDVFERIRHGRREPARGEHASRERQPDEQQRQRVVAGRLNPERGERLLDENPPAGARHERHGDDGHVLRALPALVREDACGGARGGRHQQRGLSHVLRHGESGAVRCVNDLAELVDERDVHARHELVPRYEIAQSRQVEHTADAA
jgi:hypothetical protein